MSVKQGMDVRAVRASSRELSRHAGDVDSLVSQATRSIGALRSAWKGDDFDGFATTWDTTGKTSLSTIADNLRTVSKELGRQADGQDKVSDDTGGDSPFAETGGPGKQTGEPSEPWRDPKDQWIDPSHSRKPDGDPFDPDNTRTEMPDGRTKITDDKGNTWYESADGKYVTAVQDKDGTHTETTRETLSEGEGPGSKNQTSDRWSERDGWQRRGGEGFDINNTHDNALTRWKANQDRPWNNENHRFHDEFKRAGDISEKVGKHVDGEVKNDLWEKKGSVTESWSAAEKSWGEGPNSARVSAGEFRTEADGSIGLGPTGMTAAGSIGLGAYAARAEGQFQSKEWNGMAVGGQGQAYVGGELKAQGDVSIGPGGAKVGVNAEAFAGAKAEGELTGKVGPAEVTAGGELSVGVGAHMDVDAEVTWEKVDVSFDVGAALGVGAGVKFDISFSPKDALDMLPDLF